MKAILFRYSLARFAFAYLGGVVTPRAFLAAPGPLAFKEIPEPQLPADDWAIVRTQLCGICGSDLKEIFLEGSFDNPLTSLISFPAVLGHEVAGTIERVGPGVTSRRVGERVVLNPWLSCGPRGITPPCDACRRGHYFSCRHFTDGHLPPGIHIGNCRGASGGFAPLLAAHQSQLFPIPDGVSFDHAVLADPFSVSLHAVLKSPPPEKGLALVYGCGTLGLLSIAILRALYPTARVIAIARYPHQEHLARELGAERVIRTRDRAEIVEVIAGMAGAALLRPHRGAPWLLRGVDVIYDTIGSAESFEVGVRVAQPRATIVVTGVDQPARFEWTPLYFKEIALVGSNAFGIETFEGESLHAMEIYLRLLAQKRLDTARLITHRFRLEQYREALVVGRQKHKHRAVKVVFDFRNTEG
ncbi:MAG: alcohol dehydrogenase catalytic domain-containing protein [Terriglobia bacterium]|jgi:threonine dehydrogenase-like Zn-dependent dehydrogenase